MSSLKFLYDKLLAGEVFGHIVSLKRGSTVFFDALSADSKYIRWQNYGASANKTSLESLQWILSVIFQMTPEEFLFNYTTYNEWKRINYDYTGATD